MELKADASIRLGLPFMDSFSLLLCYTLGNKDEGRTSRAG